MPSHMLDAGKESLLEEYLMTGGTMEWAQGNKAADILADRGAQLAAPPETLLWKEHIAGLMARTVQAMQVTIWAAFKGHICSDLEVSMAEVDAIAQEYDAQSLEFNELDYDDPFLAEFLGQNDSAFDVPCEEIDLFELAQIDDTHNDESHAPEAPSSNALPEQARRFADNRLVLDDLSLDKARLGTPKHDEQFGVASTDIDSKKSGGGVTALLYDTRASITADTRHFPHLIPGEFKTPNRARLKGKLTVNDVVMQIRLGFAKYQEAMGKSAAIKCLLQWVEPMVWAILQCRWTVQVTDSMSSVQKRACTMSWLEVACAMGILTGRAVFPSKSSFTMAAAVVRQMWTSISPFVVIEDEQGTTVPLRKFILPTDVAGASITCGVAFGPGLCRRIITDDHPGLALSIATLIKFAAKSEIRLNTQVPACKWFKVKWCPSGLLETQEQLRAYADKASETPATMQVDTANWRRKKTPAKKLGGPCVFGCATSTHTNPRGKDREMWYRVPNPSPWPGVQHGEALCKKCYSWGIGNPKTRKRKNTEITGPSVVTAKVGKQLRITGLVNHPELNGELCTVANPADDQDRVTAYCGERFLRLRTSNLIAPCAEQGAEMVGD